MGTIITDLKEAFRRGNIYIQLIYINVAVFVVTTLTEVILQLFNRSLGGVFEWLELPASLTQFIIQPWSLFTYMFMHAGFLHILFNMLWHILVRSTIPYVLLGQTSARGVYFRRYLRWIIVHGSL